MRISLVTAKDLDISYFVGPGKGGQNKQKNQTGVQILHRASGAIGRCSETRSQARNKATAFERMARVPKFKLWLSQRLYEIQNRETIESVVERSMSPENLRVEIKKDGRWVPEQHEDQ